MRISELFETIDQEEANQIYQSLKASGDHLTALYFQSTRNDIKHKSIDSAQRAAERMAATQQKKIDAAERRKQPQHKPERYVPPKEYSDNFRGNQYVTRARKELPPQLKRFLPIIDQGLIGTVTGNWSLGMNIGRLLSS